MQEIRCEKCNKLLFKITDDKTLTDLTMELREINVTSKSSMLGAPYATDRKIECKCSRCGTFNIVPLD